MLLWLPLTMRVLDAGAAEQGTPPAGHHSHHPVYHQCRSHLVQRHLVAESSPAKLYDNSTLF